MLTELYQLAANTADMQDKIVFMIKIKQLIYIFSSIFIYPTALKIYDKIVSCLKNKKVINDNQEFILTTAFLILFSAFYFIKLIHWTIICTRCIATPKLVYMKYLYNLFK